MGRNKSKIGFFEIVMFTIYLPPIVGIYALLLEFTNVRESLLEPYHYILHLLAVVGASLALTLKFRHWLKSD